jgi:hypothetical protein
MLCNSSIKQNSIHYAKKAIGWVIYNQPSKVVIGNASHTGTYLQVYGRNSLCSIDIIKKTLNKISYYNCTNKIEHKFFNI